MISQRAFGLSNRRPLFAAFLVLCATMAAGPAGAAYDDPAITLQTISSASGANQPILVLNAGGSTSVTLQASAANFTPTSYQWSQVPETLNSFAAPLTASFSAAQTGVPQVTVTLPAAGIYQFAVTGSDGTHQVTRNTWVNVWDNRPALAPTGVLGKNPGLTPPTSVRSLSPDPGPNCHPRVLFSRADWPEFSGRAVQSTEASTAIAVLRTGLAGGFDKATTALGTLAADYYAYGQGGYVDSYRTGTLQPAYAAASTGDLLLGGSSPTSSIYSSLLSACYLAWIGTDPTLAQASVPAAQQSRFTYLATVTAAAAHYELLSGNVPSAKGFHLPANLALCYDLVYDWMTPQQRIDTRDYLYAIGYDVYNTFSGGIGGNPGPVPSGSHMNGGDFPNLADGIIMPALAIEGEESMVTPAVQAAYFPIVPAATGPGSWPNSSPASVSNLHRQIRYLSEWSVTPWGFVLNMVDYFQLGENTAAPGTFAFARRGENGWVTTNMYQASLAALYNLAHRESNAGNGVGLFDHHDGGGFGDGPGAEAQMYLAKYMYPDDSMVDYVYRAFRNEVTQPLVQAVFGTDPGTATLPAVAQAKNLALTKFDPLRSVAVSRNSWNQNDLNLIFENRFDSDGHQHAEHNSFSLYALGRAWSNPPGYHCTINDLQATVLVQDPRFTGDAATQGYIGQGPSSAVIATGAANQPSNNAPPGKLLEVSEEPNRLWTVFAGDATSEYTYANSGSLTLDTGIPAASYPYPSLEDDLLASDIGSYLTGDLFASFTFNPVEYALRSVLTVRGTNPYVLVIDDFNKDGTAHNYRWSMSCALSFGPSGGLFVDANNNAVFSSLAMSPGATPTDATLYHLIDAGTAAGLPRLLVRDVSEQNNASQPAIFLDDRPSGFAGGNLTYGLDNNSGKYSLVPSNRVLIERDNVASPAYKVLLFPYLTGTTTPATAWNASHTVLTVSQSNGTVDQITLDATQADHRTRVAAFARSTGTGAPTLTLPGNLTVLANTTLSDGTPAGVATYTASARDAAGNALTPVANFPSGTALPVGINTVVVSALDARGQERTGTFTITVTPPPPVVAVTSIANLGVAPYGVSLSWPAVAGVTGYNVKRATSAGGPYTTLATLPGEVDTTYTDNTAANPGYFYAVTALLNSFESANSNVIALAPATTPLTGQGVALTGAGGVYQTGGTYLVSGEVGSIGGYGDSFTFLSAPWSGDGTFTARLASLYSLLGNVSAYANVGVAFRADATSKAVTSLAGYSLHPPTFVDFLDRTATGGNLTNGGQLNQVAVPVWLRLARVGTTFTASTSPDGNVWSVVGTPLALPNMPSTGLAGLALGPSSGPAANAVFDNVIFVGSPTVTLGNGKVTLTWTNSFGASSYTVLRATSANGPFVAVASGLKGTSYVDVPPGGGAYYYTLVANGAGGTSGASAPEVTVSLPLPPVSAAETAYRLTLSGGTAQVACAVSVIGRHYQLQQSSTLLSNGWVNVGSSQRGDGSPITFTVPSVPGGSQFFRVLIGP